MQEIVKSISIENMTNQRAAVVAKLNQAFDLLGEAERLASAAKLGFPRLSFDPTYTLRGQAIGITGDYSKRAEAEAAALRVIDADGWTHLLDESGLKTFMDSITREKWREQLTEGDIPALTAENVKATFLRLYETRGDMYENGIVQCFKRLSWDYKTNQPFLFGKRIIMSFFFTYGTPNYQKIDMLGDVLRVFHIADGQPEPDHRHGVSELVWSAHHKGLRDAENDYIKVKWFKNGNAHITFKRLDLVDSLNAIIAKHYPGALAADNK